MLLRKFNRYFANLRLVGAAPILAVGVSFGGVPHVQKGAALIVYDRRIAISIATSALALGLFTSLAAPASALDTEAHASASQPTVSIVRDGVDLPYGTKAHTVGAFLAEREIKILPGESVSPDTDDAIVDGMKIVLRPAPARSLPSASRDVTRRPAHRAAARVVAWTTHRSIALPAKLKHLSDSRLPAGTTRVADAGRAGVRVITYRFVRRGDARPVRTVLASRIVRMPRARVIVHGVAAYASLARVAEQGFTSAMHFAGSAIHMIATAYTAGCYGCSGITASGVRAGLGVIAVDPRVIPLGTKLFIPGYGRAVAGDTGGAILGNRVDLGMNTLHEALRFGRRPITVYVLR